MILTRAKFVILFLLAQKNNFHFFRKKLNLFPKVCCRYENSISREKAPGGKILIFVVQGVATI
jgi:hypothetical protein